MKRFITLTLFLLVTLSFGMAKKCGKPKTGDFNKAELGQNWETFKHDTSFNVWVFRNEDGYQNRPQRHLTPRGVQIFWNGTVNSEELRLAEEGVSEMFSMCQPKFQYWLGKNVWNQMYFTRLPDYKIILVPSNYTLQEGEAAGCGGIITGAHGDCGGGTGTCTAAGTVGGLNDRVNSSTPGSKGGVYIIVPKQSAEQWARSECRQLYKDAIRNEAEHVVFTNVPQIYFAFAGDGVNGNHPYCAMTTSRSLKFLEDVYSPVR